MAKYRKLSRTSDQRKALLRSQVTSLLYHGKIVTTEAKAKEIRKIAEGLVAMAVREKDNFETVTVTAKVARKDAEGKRVKEVVDGKKVYLAETTKNLVFDVLMVETLQGCDILYLQTKDNTLDVRNLNEGTYRVVSINKKGYKHTLGTFEMKKN